MDEPKYVVCMQGVQGFVADYGDLDLATAKAMALCQRGTDTYILSPLKTFRDVEGVVVPEDSVVEASALETEVANSEVIQRVLTARKAVSAPQGVE